MPYVTSIERMGQEKGREEARATERADFHDVISAGLVAKFASAGKKLASKVRECEDIARLKVINRTLITAKTIKEVEKALVED